MKTRKPKWWPQNPYPKWLFPMTGEQYAKAIPDPQKRTAISGGIGRYIWQNASDMIWERMLEVGKDRSDSIQSKGGKARAHNLIAKQRIKIANMTEQDKLALAAFQAALAG